MSAARKRLLLLLLDRDPDATHRAIAGRWRGQEVLIVFVARNAGEMALFSSPHEERSPRSGYDRGGRERESLPQLLDARALNRARHLVLLVTGFAADSVPRAIRPIVVPFAAFAGVETRPK